MNLQIRADTASKAEYYIDFARGSIYHSQTASRGQKNRIFNEVEAGGLMKYLSYPQAFDYFKKNKVAEYYLLYLRQLYNIQHLEPSHKLEEEFIKLLPLTVAIT